jgi:uncharacterized membrane protein
MIKGRATRIIAITVRKSNSASGPHAKLSEDVAMIEESKDLNSASPKTWLGMPVNWDWKHWYKAMWNDEDDRVLAPKRLGIGWTINFHAMPKRACLLK